MVVLPKTSGESMLSFVNHTQYYNKDRASDPNSKITDYLLLSTVSLLHY